MSNNGTNEHRWEFRTQIMLAIEVLICLACLNWKWSIFIWFITVWAIMVFMAHGIARWFHMLERREHGNPNWWKLWK